MITSNGWTKLYIYIPKMGSAAPEKFNPISCKCTQESIFWGKYESSVEIVF